MGVPALFRWLSNKYPKIISPVIEEQEREIDGVKIPIDTTKANPNGEEFDNLYLDMNGIVHPCSHPEDRPPPANEEEMMIEVFKYTERVVNMVRPRKLLMIAVDGVAPRAKMNQQRSRRFRSAQEAKEKDEDKKEFLEMLKAKNGGVIDEEIEKTMQKKTWDSNSITPGTPFMNILALSLRYWCSYKLNTDPAWAKLKVIISDATVPGEGEHKIMNFVRSQRRSPHHDPNTRHVIYGLDADLIMLGLATHEPHFRVLREDVFFQEAKGRTCNMCGQKGHIAAECRGEAKKKEDEHDIKQSASPLKPFIWLHVSILREYLEIELSVPEAPFPMDLERALDDWVFMCFFVGNDFLPHLPSLDIREQGIDTLIAIWRDNLPAMGGYVTKDGHVDLKRAQYILSGLAKQEDMIFKRRRQEEERREQRQRRREEDEKARKRPRISFDGNESRRGGNRKNDPGITDPSQYFDPRDAQSKETRAMTHDMFVNRKAIYEANQANKSAAEVLRAQLKAKSTGSADGNANGHSTMEQDSTPETPAVETSPSALGKRKADLVEDDPGTPGRDTPISEVEAEKVAEEEGPPEDSVRLWEPGYADRYYEQKFKVDPKDIEFRHKVARDYVEGLCWVLLYYFQGCPSWTWYYPHHYAPFAADFVNIGEMEVKFDKGKPFRPYEQLMGVMPAASSHTLPEPFRDLMSNENSEIYDFYPTDFPIDLNGKKFAWQGVALLPFIDEKRLLDAMATRYPMLTAEEHERNEPGKDALLFSNKHPMYQDIVAKFYSKKGSTDKLTLNPKSTEGLMGKVEANEEYIPGRELTFPLASDKMPHIEDDQSMTVHYEMPVSTTTHKSMLLRGLVMPKKALDQDDIEKTRSRARTSGRSFGGAPFRGGRGGRGGANYRSDYGGGRGGGNGGGYNGGYNGGNDSYRPPANGQFNNSNPFAAHLIPGFDPAAMGRGMPPPPGAGYGQNYGYPPQQGSYNGYNNYQGNNHYQGRGGYGGGGGGGYRGGNQGGRGGGYNNGGYQNQRRY